MQVKIISLHPLCNWIIRRNLVQIARQDVEVASELKELQVTWNISLSVAVSDFMDNLSNKSPSTLANYDQKQWNSDPFLNLILAHNFY